MFPHWFAQEYLEADKGTPPAGGGEGDDKNKGDDPPKTLPAGGEAGGEDERKHTDADVNRIVTQRLTEEKERERKRTEGIRRQAEADAAAKNGEWQKVAESRAEEIADLTKRVEELEGQLKSKDLDAVRARVALRHKLPEALVSRLQGTDEATLEADAKALAKLVVPPKAPDTEAGKGAGGNGNVAPTDEQVKAQLRAI
jgi:hypothetical protein